MMSAAQQLLRILEGAAGEWHPLIHWSALGKLAGIDLSSSNPHFTEAVYKDFDRFSEYINKQREEKQAAFLVGGYAEDRQMYRRSSLFDSDPFNPHELTEEPRSLHLGIDVWGPAGTPIYAPLGGMVHSFAFHREAGNYGATIILSHQLDGFGFYALYGHLALADIQSIREGQYISRGECFAHFGKPEENGNWPPHLHLQLIADIGVYEGDYPGVCRPSEASKYLDNCPDPSIFLRKG